MRKRLPPDTIPRDIRKFVARYLPGVEYLDAFMLLCHGRARSWSASDIANATGLAESVAADVLERLASDNFLHVQISSEIRYRFNPASTALAELSRRCADLYVRQRTAMTVIVTKSAVRPMHNRAGAFQAKKGTKNG